MKTRQDDDDRLDADGFDRDGVKRTNGVFRVPMRIMDERAMADSQPVVDALGGPAGFRPGFAFPRKGSEAARQQEINEAVRMTHLAMYLNNLQSSGVDRAEYVRRLNDAWKQP